MALMGTTSAVRVVGLNSALELLASDLKKIPLKTLQGMIAGGLVVQRAAQKLTPVDTANLKASATTVWGMKKGGGSPAFKGKDAGEMSSDHQKTVASEQSNLSKNPLTPEVEVLYSAAYALFVHEDLEANHINGQAKFLEKAVKDNLDKIVSAVKMEAGNP